MALYETNKMLKMAVAEKIFQIFGRRQNCNRILLINPPLVNENRLDITLAKNKRYYAYPPYGLGILCTNLKMRGYTVQLLDLNIEVLMFTNNLKEHFNITELISKRWKDKLKKTIMDFNPNVVGISCTFTMCHEMMIKVADFVNSCNEKIPIIAGGVYVTSAPEIVLRDGKNIDFVYIHEGDYGFPDMLNFINGKTTVDRLVQIGTLIDDTFVYIKEKNIPDSAGIEVIPNYLDLPIDKYNSFGEIGTFRYWQSSEVKGSTILSNRGCRGRCSFCSVRHFSGIGVRSRSVKSVIDEIEELKSRYNINHITWLDDDLFFNSNRAIQLFTEIIKRNLNITWDASNGIIVSAVANCPKLIPIAVESGCIGMYFGIESGNPEILRRMHKLITVKQCLEVGKIMENFPQIFTRGFLIIGFPNETLGQIADTIKLALEMSLDWYTVSLLTPLLSTELYDSFFKEKETKRWGSADGKNLNSLLSFVGYGYNVRYGEDRRIIEERGQTSARNFLFNESDFDVVPSREELNDLWLIIDYKINYEQILTQNNPAKLQKKHKFLKDVCDRTTLFHPLANLFLGIVEKKMGDSEEAQKRFLLSKEYLDRSLYWQKFFNALNLRDLYNKWE